MTGQTVVYKGIVLVTTFVVCWLTGQLVTLGGHAVTVMTLVVYTTEVVNCAPVADADVGVGVAALVGLVKTTMVGVGPQTWQTVMYVVQPEGTGLGVCVAGHTVVVYVVVIVVKPVGQISTYSAARMVSTSAIGTVLGETLTGDDRGRNI